METIFRLKPEEIDERLLLSIKAAFPFKTIEVRVSDVINDEDETAYLMQSPANRKDLLESIANIERGENLVTVAIEDLTNIEKLESLAKTIRP